MTHWIFFPGYDEVTPYIWHPLLTVIIIIRDREKTYISSNYISNVDCLHGIIDYDYLAVKPGTEKNVVIFLAYADDSDEIYQSALTAKRFLDAIAKQQRVAIFAEFSVLDIGVTAVGAIGPAVILADMNLAVAAFRM